MIKRLIRQTEELLRLPLRDWLMISCGFSCLLLAARLVMTGYYTYVFLTWNLFLAVVPYLISDRVLSHPRVATNRLLIVPVLLIWLAFIPNAFYIITDLFHLDKFDKAPKWFDLLLIFSFAWNGLLLGWVSIARVERIVEIVVGRGFSLLVIFIVMWLTAFGIYIGRYLRYNSWDIVMQPFALFSETGNLIMQPFANQLEWGMIAVYAVFMTLSYISVKKLGEGFNSPGQANI